MALDLANQAYYQGLLPRPCLDVGPDGILPIRCPLAEVALLHPDLLTRMQQPSGVSLAFETDARVCRLRYRFATEVMASCAGRNFPACPPAAMPLEALPLYELIAFDLWVDGVFFARLTNDPPIKGCSVNNLWTTAEPKPIRYLLRGLAPNYQELRRRMQAIPREDWGRYAQGEVVFAGLPPGRKRLELYLPEKVAVRLQSMHLEGGAGGPPAPLADERPLFVAYGSSITQGMPFANGPSSVWPVVAGRAAGLRVLNLGVAGQCHLDQQVARLLRDAPAACFSLKLGINVHNLGSMSMRSFAEAVLGFILTVRDGHPKTPICVVSPIWGGYREVEGWDTDVRMDAPAHCPSLGEMRVLLRQVVVLLQSRGDANLHYLDGLSLVDEQMAGAMPDDLHPDGDCYERMGLRFAELAFGPEGLLLPGRLGRATGQIAVPQRPVASDFVDWRGLRSSGARL